ncbi:MAG TPA: lipopolysaccharide biosynthesis protein [Microthrixaceae bacterium]|nr:lipopolysaccharide biosynthesis protein [Microthrixaceae bacterium]
MDLATAHILDSGADLATEGDLPPDLTSRAAGGFLWALIGFVILQIGGFGTYALAANVLDVDDLGTVAKVLTVVFWMDVLLDLGMGAAVIHDQEKGQTLRVKVAFTVNTALAIAASTVVLVASPWIADFFGVPDEAWLFRLLAVSALVRGLNQVPEALMRRDLDFRRRSSVDFVRAVTRFGLAAVLLASGVGPAALVLSVVAADIAALVVTLFLTRFRPSFRFDRAEASQMLRFGASVFGARAAGMLWLNGDYLVVGAKLDNRAYGDYFTAFRLPELVLGSFYNIFSSVAFPTYSAAREEGPERLQAAYLRSLRLLCLFGFPAGLGMSLVARDFIDTVFSDHPGAIAPMQLLCLAGSFVAIGYASGDLFNAIGKPHLGLYFNLIGAPILIGAFLLVADDGIDAIAMVHLIVVIPYSLFRLWFANHLIGTKWGGVATALRPAVAAVIGIAVLALPIRLMTEAGFLPGVAIAVAGAIGAVIGVFLGDRSTFGELRELAVKAVRN